MSYLPFAATRTSIRYGFAVGRVRVLETKVFGKATYERLLDAHTYSEQRRILSDTVYGRYLEGAETPAAVEEALWRALGDFYGFLDEAQLPPSVVRYFRVRYDFANLKGALKARALGITPAGLFVDLGTIPLEQLSEPLDRLPEPFGSLAARLEATEPEEASARGSGVFPDSSGDVPEGLGATPDAELARIDFEVDKAMFSELAAAAAKSKSRFLKELAALEVDIANVKVLVRSRLGGATAGASTQPLFDGGAIGRERLEEFAALPPIEAAVSLARVAPFSGLSMSDLADPSRLDVVADNVIARFLRHGRTVPVGVEPVISYVLSRAAEVAVLRVLLLGRLNGLDSELLRGRLRDVYV